MKKSEYEKTERLEYLENCEAVLKIVYLLVKNCIFVRTNILDLIEKTLYMPKDD